MNENTNFSGDWESTHWYPTADDNGEHADSYMMTAHQKGHEIVFESKPRDNGSYLIIRLHIDGDLATGTWEESTAPEGSYDGTIYTGAGQLILDDDKQRMFGKWAGIGVNHKTNKREIYTGSWQLARAKE
jgi:hypothetical protein